MQMSICIDKGCTVCDVPNNDDDKDESNFGMPVR